MSTPISFSLHVSHMCSQDNHSLLDSCFGGALRAAHVFPIPFTKSTNSGNRAVDWQLERISPVVIPRSEGLFWAVLHLSLMAAKVRRTIMAAYERTIKHSQDAVQQNLSMQVVMACIEIADSRARTRKCYFCYEAQDISKLNRTDQDCAL